MKLKIKMCFSFGALYYFQILQNYANETHSTCIYSIVFPKNLNQVLVKNKEQITPLFFIDFLKKTTYCDGVGLEDLDLHDHLVMEVQSIFVKSS